MTKLKSPSSNPKKRLAGMDRATDLLRSSAFQLTEEFERLSRLTDPFPHTTALEQLVNSQRWADLSPALRALENAAQPLTSAQAANLFADLKSWAVPPELDSIRKLSKHITDLALSADRAILPAFESLQSLTERATATLKTSLAAEAFAHREATLLTRMAAINSPWALEDCLGVSVTGFARIARLRDLPKEVESYAAPASDVYQEELGNPVPFDDDSSPDHREVAAVNAGLNPELIAFPRSEYPTVLIAAGFEFEFKLIEAPVSDKGDGSGLFDPKHSALLCHLEQSLRSTVETKLKAAAGHKWIRQRVPPDVRRRWEERRQRDLDQRGDAYALIQYTDFMDLSQIICQGNNWTEVFASMFSNKKHFEVSMERLSPVRNAIGHSRPLVRTDQLTLFSEASRLLSAIGASFIVGGSSQGAKP